MFQRPGILRALQTMLLRIGILGAEQGPGGLLRKTFVLKHLLCYNTANKCIIGGSL